MTKLLDQAIAAVRKLPPEQQDEAALALMHIANSNDAPRLTPDQEARVRASMAAQDFLSDDEVAALYAQYGV